MTRDQEPPFISPQDRQPIPEGNGSGQMNPPRLAELLRNHLILAKGAVLGVGSGLVTGAAFIVATHEAGIGDPNSRALGALVVALTSITWVHLRGMRSDYRSLLHPSRKA